jgi:hypothetical protein
MVNQKEQLTYLTLAKKTYVGFLEPPDLHPLVGPWWVKIPISIKAKNFNFDKNLS